MVRIGCCVAVRAAGTYVPRSLTMWDRRFGSRGSSGGVSDVAAQSRICNALPKAKCRSKSRRTFAFLVSRRHTHIYHKSTYVRYQGYDSSALPSIPRLLARPTNNTQRIRRAATSTWACMCVLAASPSAPAPPYRPDGPTWDVV
jgi:hypothetical protein